jgi:hypothetical protein
MSIGNILACCLCHGVWTVQLEVAFDSMVELDAFWSAIPPERHRAWSQRAQHVIIDGSPQVVLRPPCKMYAALHADACARFCVQTSDLLRLRVGSGRCFEQCHFAATATRAMQSQQLYSQVQHRCDVASANIMKGSTVMGRTSSSSATVFGACL